MNFNIFLKVFYIHQNKHKRMYLVDNTPIYRNVNVFNLFNLYQKQKLLKRCNIDQKFKIEVFRPQN